MKSTILSVVGFVLVLVGLAMFLPLLFAVFYGESREIVVFVMSMTITALTGFLIYRYNSPDKDLSIKEGILIGAIGWLVVPIFGSLPYMLSGVFTNVFDAYFEAVSGFTTTGATVLADIEIVPRSILLWRSFTQWLGGMGILLAFVALINRTGIGSTRLLKAETAGPIVYKIVPRMSQYAKYVWIVYISLTALALLALSLTGLNFFDSLNHTFTCISTGGFSTMNQGLSAFNNHWVEFVVFLFIVIGGGNFLLYYVVISSKKPLMLFKDEEYRTYLVVLLASFLLILPFLHYFDSPLDAIRYGSFQVASLKTGTGHFSYDYDQWGSLAKTFLFVLMFFGGCQYSTTGGIKMVRMLIAGKFMVGEITRQFHPNIVNTIKVNHEQIQPNVVNNVVGFFLLLCNLFFHYCHIIGRIWL